LKTILLMRLMFLSGNVPANLPHQLNNHGHHSNDHPLRLLLCLWCSLCKMETEYA
jgi:hypothetical protein